MKIALFLGGGFTILTSLGMGIGAYNEMGVMGFLLYLAGGAVAALPFVALAKILEYQEKILYYQTQGICPKCGEK